MMRTARDTVCIISCCIIIIFCLAFEKSSEFAFSFPRENSFTPLYRMHVCSAETSCGGLAVPNGTPHTTQGTAPEEEEEEVTEIIFPSSSLLPYRYG